MRTGNQLSGCVCASVTALILCAAGLSSVTAQTAAPRNPPRAPEELPARAQTPAQTTTEGQSTAPDTVDLAITAHVTARELKFNVVPNPTVEFPGRPRRETVWEAERHNLPQSVRPGETYRDIGITLRITSVFADIDRIVAEALGEIPAREDDAPRQQPSNSPGASTPDASAASAPRAQALTPRRRDARRGNRK